MTEAWRVARRMSKLGPEGAGLVLERALADARRDALEEAAKVCDRELELWLAHAATDDPQKAEHDDQMTWARTEECRDLAEAIRALIPPEPRE